MHHVRIKMPGVAIGTITKVNREGRPIVQFDAGDGSGVHARVVWMQNPPDWEKCIGLPVVLGFENGDETLPVVLGLLENPPKKEENPVTEDTSKIIHLKSEKELILECGDAKIRLRADGRISILGGYIVSRSSGVNKIKGGSVQIN